LWAKLKDVFLKIIHFMEKLWKKYWECIVFCFTEWTMKCNEQREVLIPLWYGDVSLYDWCTKFRDKIFKVRLSN
jgi:hypothetical protein